MTKSIGSLTTSLTTGSQSRERTDERPTGTELGKGGSEQNLIECPASGEMVPAPAWTESATRAMSRGMLRPALSSVDFQEHAEFIVGAVSSLLAHYFDPRHHDEMIRVLMADWVDVLEPFSQPCIAEARRRWIEGQTRRPSPADLKRLCMKVAIGD